MDGLFEFTDIDDVGMMVTSRRFHGPGNFDVIVSTDCGAPVGLVRDDVERLIAFLQDAIA